jgi:hypothetical protein
VVGINESVVGRVSMAAETLTAGPQTISIAAGALLVSAVDYRLLLLVVAIGMLSAATYLWRGRQMTSPPVSPVRVVCRGGDRASSDVSGGRPPSTR